MRVVRVGDTCGAAPPAAAVLDAKCLAAAAAAPPSPAMPPSALLSTFSHLDGRSLSVANNDWWLEESSVDLIAPYWAEVSLRVAERVLHDQLGLARPAWLNAAYYRKSVLGI